jgi:hypothetical protein
LAVISPTINVRLVTVFDAIEAVEALPCWQMTEVRVRAALAVHRALNAIALAVADLAAVLVA